MLSCLVVEAPDSGGELASGLSALARIYPWIPMFAEPPRVSCSLAELVVAVERWSDPSFDPTELDQALTRRISEEGAVCLRVAGPCGAARCLSVALEVLTRCQRLMEGRNSSSADPLFDRALGLHRALHDSARPLHMADLAHARDTWRWVLRLSPEAALDVQLAALFHDIERLVSEGDVRVEHESPDYDAFKAAHAEAGARMVADLLAEIGAPAGLRQRVVDLVRVHERPGPRPELVLLNDADGLSFFSLNACGFADYYGLAHTRRKVAFTLGRLSPRARRELGRIRHRADVGGLLAAALAGRGEGPAPAREAGL